MGHIYVGSLRKRTYIYAAPSEISTSIITPSIKLDTSPQVWSSIFSHISTITQSDHIFIMSFELKEAELSDIDEIGAILDKVYAKDPLISQLVPLVDAERSAAFWAGWLQGDFPKQGEKLFKMVEASSGYVYLSFNCPSMVSCLLIYGFNFFRKIVAFLKARYPAPKLVDPDGAGIPFPEGSNGELLNHCFENMDIFEDKHMDYDKDCCESLGASRATNLLVALSLESAILRRFSYDDQG
jgi:hypothetical protein